MARISCIHKTATSCTPSATIYSTIDAWEDSCNRAVNGDETGVICDDVAYDEENEFLVTESGTSIVRLTANDGVMFTHIDGSPVGSVRGDGSMRSGARIHNTAGTTNVVYLRSEYMIIDHLNIIQSADSAADDPIQLVGGAVSNQAIINCNIECTTGANDQDGINLNDLNGGAILINGVAILNPPRAGIHYWQNASSGTYDLDSLHVYHCGMYSDIGDDFSAALVKMSQNSTGATSIVEVYNNAGGYIEDHTGTRVAPFADGTNTDRATPDGSCTWNGSHNFSDPDTGGLDDLNSGDVNITDWIHGSDATSSTATTTKTSGSYWVVNDVAADGDLTPLDDAAGNAIIAAGTATANLPSTGNATIDAWWQTINESGAIDKRGHRFGSGDAGDADAPDVGPFSYADNVTSADLPFTAQVISI